MMEPTVKNKWIEALRSGEFKQWHGSLYDENFDGYCCLGVLCELHAREFGELWHGRSYYDEVSELPWEVQVWAGLRNDPIVYSTHFDPSYVRQNDMFTLTVLNDGMRREGETLQRRLDFNEIADVIESDL